MREDTRLLSLKLEEGAMDQGMQAVWRNWKTQGNRFCPSSSRGTQPPPPAPDTRILDFKSPKIVREYICVIYILSMWVTC